MSAKNSFGPSDMLIKDEIVELERYPDYVGYYYRQAYIDAAKAMNIKITPAELDHPKVLPIVLQTTEENKNHVKL